MTSLRRNLALLESATDELTAHFTRRSIELASNKGDLVGSIQLALTQLRYSPDLARTTLERALERNRL